MELLRFDQILGNEGSYGASVICPRGPELVARCCFLELGNFDVSHTALDATHLVAKARRLVWQNGNTPSPFLMELSAPKQSCGARSEKTGVPRVTVGESFHGLFSDCQTCDFCLFFEFRRCNILRNGLPPPPAQKSIAARVRTVTMSRPVRKLIAFRSPLLLGIPLVVW